jgi:hypothetical protein
LDSVRERRHVVDRQPWHDDDLRRERPGHRQATMTDYPQKITFGEMRASGTRDILIYCRDYRCGRHVEKNADDVPDDLRLSDIEPYYYCSRCGKGCKSSH